MTLRVREGEIFGILGPNGAGKTTLIKILCTLLRPNSGKATIYGLDVVRQSTAARRMIGLVNCDDRSHFWRLSARENLRFYAALNNLPQAQAEDRIQGLLELTGLAGAAEVRLGEFSSGMKQRLAIARGLLAEPRILFMDEPSRSLDPMGAYDLRRFIRDEVVRTDGRTVVVATNLMEEASFLCDRLALLHHGRVQVVGTQAELRQMIADVARYRLTLRKADAEAIAGVEHLTNVTWTALEQTDGESHILELHVRQHTAGLSEALHLLCDRGVEIWECESEKYSLEDVFRTVMSGQENGEADKRMQEVRSEELERVSCSE